MCTSNTLTLPDPTNAVYSYVSPFSDCSYQTASGPDLVEAPVQPSVVELWKPTLLYGLWLISACRSGQPKLFLTFFGLWNTSSPPPLPPPLVVEVTGQLPWIACCWVKGRDTDWMPFGDRTCCFIWPMNISVIKSEPVFVYKISWYVGSDKT